MYPVHWGLKGQMKELALIDFHYEGFEADVKRAEVLYLNKSEREQAINEIHYKHDLYSEYEYELNKVKIDIANDLLPKSLLHERQLELQLKHGQIDEQTYDREYIELIRDEDKKYLAALKYSLKYDEITQNEYDKELSTFNKEPWFSFDVDFDEENNDLIMSFDYNEYFWKKLRAEGHPGNDENEIIDNFIKDWGRKLATEDYSGDYDTKLTSVNDEMNQQTGSTDSGFKIYE